MAGNYSNYSSGKELVNLEENIEETEAVIILQELKTLNDQCLYSRHFEAIFFWQTNAFVVKS